MIKPLVTVAIITYNSSQFIKETLDSVINQTYDNWEIIVGDDGSTDDTPEILKKYKNILGNKIKIILHEDNQGANSNWNSITSFFRGKYIAKLDGDDFWDKSKLEIQVKYMENNSNVVISYHPVYKYLQTNKKKVKHKSLLIKGKGDEILMKNGCFVCSPSVMWRNFNENNVHSDLTKVGDWYLWILIGSKGNIGYVEDRLAYYRVHANNVTVKGNKVEYIMDNIRIIEILGKKLRFNEQLIKNALHHQYFYIGTTYIRLGEINKAKEYIDKISFSKNLSFKRKVIKLIFILRLENVFNWIFEIRRDRGKNEI